MNTQDLILESVLSGQDLFVVLKSTDADPYMECYELPIIIIKDGILWGKFREVHSTVGHPIIKTCKRVAYSYSNVHPIVCTSSMEGNIERYVSHNIYADKRFKTKGIPNMLWQESRDGSNYPTEVMLREVESCKRFKIIIETENTTFILPIHTLEVFLSGRFNADTEMDGIPKNLLNNDFLRSLSDQFSQVMRDTDIQAPNTNYAVGSDFYTLSFMYGGRKLIQKTARQDDIIGEYLSYKDIKIISID